MLGGGEEDRGSEVEKDGDEDGDGDGDRGEAAAERKAGRADDVSEAARRERKETLRQKRTILGRTETDFIVRPPSLCSIHPNS
mmetsp:Transcript_26686/g.61403  ORF Transcript_26686/g.61403 Transcript_26686/m.61403 type:complete len:83 (-) Transcript_26686:35-283(-)